jgi:hypothetical protein
MADEQSQALPTPIEGMAPPAPPLAPTSEPSTQTISYSDPTTFKREGDTADQTVHYSDPTTYGTAKNTPADVTAFKSEVQKGVRSKFGNFIHELFTGEKPQTYHTDENGQVVADPQEPRKPGQIFRHILAGALLGASDVFKAAAGGEGHALKDSIERDQATDEKARQHAQQDLQNRLQLKKEKREETAAISQKDLNDALIAQHKITTISTINHISNMAQEALDNHNAFVNTLHQNLATLEAKPLEIPGNGKKGDSGAEALVAYSKNPKFYEKPGFSIMPVYEVDTKGLTWNAEKNGWFDKDNKRADVQALTTVTLYQVPDKSYNTSVEMTGAQVNKLFHTDLKSDEMKRIPLSVLVSQEQHNAEAAHFMRMDSEKARAETISKTYSAFYSGPVRSNAVRLEKIEARITAMKNAFTDDKDPTLTALQAERASVEQRQARLDMAGQALIGGDEDRYKSILGEMTPHPPSKPGMEITLEEAKKYVDAYGVEEGIRQAQVDRWGIKALETKPQAEIKPAAAESKTTELQRLPPAEYQRYVDRLTNITKDPVRAKEMMKSIKTKDQFESLMTTTQPWSIAQ